MNLAWARLGMRSRERAAGLAQFLRRRQRNRAAMFGFLDVVPDELILQPCCLACGEIRVGSCGLVSDGEAVAALSADDHFHRLIA